MTDNKHENKIIVKTDSTGIIKVGNSLKLTDKIIQEYDNRVLQSSFPTVKIGNQEWMTENLDVDCYSNGDPIPQVQNPKEWENLKTGAWSYYDNDSANGLKYGKIYNWFAVNDERGLAPKGFEVASIENWHTLFQKLGEDVAGYKLKSTSGWKENGNGNNEVNLNIHPAGYRMYNIFIGKDDYTHIWTSTEKNENSAIFVNFNYYANNVFSTDTFKYTGSYVRCIKL